MNQIITIIFLTCFFFNVKGQLLEPFRAAMDNAGDAAVQASINMKYANEQQDKVKKDVKEAKKEALKAAYEARQNSWFAKNVGHIKNLIQHLDDLTCLYRELDEVLSFSTSLGTSNSCYGSIRYQMYGEMIINNVIALRSLIEATFQHVGAVKQSASLVKINNSSAELTEDMKKDIDSENQKIILAKGMIDNKNKLVADFVGGYYADLNQRK